MYIIYKYTIKYDIIEYIIMQYIEKHSYVYCAMIDLSKTSHEINHDIMIDKLLNSIISGCQIVVLERIGKIEARRSSYE